MNYIATSFLVLQAVNSNWAWWQSISVLRNLFSESTSPYQVHPSPVQCSPSNFWTRLGLIPYFTGPGLHWPGLLWASPLGPMWPDYAGGYYYTESTNRLMNDCSLVIQKSPCTPHPIPIATGHSPLTTLIYWVTAYTPEWLLTSHPPLIPCHATLHWHLTTLIYLVTEYTHNWLLTCHPPVSTLHYSPLAILNFTFSTLQDPQIQTVYIAWRYGFGNYGMHGAGDYESWNMVRVIILLYIWVLLWTLRSIDIGGWPPGTAVLRRPTLVPFDPIVHHTDSAVSVIRSDRLHDSILSHPE